MKEVVKIEVNSIEYIKGEFNKKGYNLIDSIYNGCKEILTYEKDGYYYTGTYNGFIKTNNPKKWGINNKYSIQNINKFLKDNERTCVVVSKEYDYNNIELLCECGEKYTVNLSNLLNKNQFTCPKCGTDRGAKNHRNYKENKIFENLGLTPIEDCKGIKNTIYCSTKEGYIIYSSPYNLSRSNRDYLYLFSTRNKYTLQNIRKFLELNTNGVTLVSEKYYGMKSKMNFKCFCGQEYSTTIGIMSRGSSLCCKRCLSKESSLEKKTSEHLSELGFDYVREKRFKDCKDKGMMPFDFYVPSLNLCIECQGEQHYRNIVTFGSGLEYVQKHDRMKKQYCIDNCINYLDLPYQLFKNEDYKDVIEKHISNID